jgi:hypothetical protein
VPIFTLNAKEDSVCSLDFRGIKCHYKYAKDGKRRSPHKRRKNNFHLEPAYSYVVQVSRKWWNKITIKTFILSSQNKKKERKK